MTNRSAGIEMSRLPALDKEGYIQDITAWNTDVASAIAAQELITLSEDHWRVIYALRSFYAATDASPAMRARGNVVKRDLGPELGSSIALMTLFGESPAKMAAKIAGLPKPPNCL